MDSLVNTPELILPYNDKLDLCVAYVHKCTFLDSSAESLYSKYLPKGNSLIRVLKTKTNDKYILCMGDNDNAFGVVIPSTECKTEIVDVKLEIITPSNILELYTSSHLTLEQIKQIEKWTSDKHSDIILGLMSVFGPTDLAPHVRYNEKPNPVPEDMTYPDFSAFQTTKVDEEELPDNPKLSSKPESSTDVGKKPKTMEELGTPTVDEVIRELVKSTNRKNKDDFKKVVDHLQSIYDYDSELPFIILEVIAYIRKRLESVEIHNVSQFLKCEDDTGKVSKYAVYNALERYFETNSDKDAYTVIYHLLEDVLLKKP